MQIGRRIYFDTTTGETILVIAQRSGAVTETTVEHDVETYNLLSQRNRESFDFLQLEYGEHDESFAACNGYKVNPSTKQLEFSYPDTNKPEPEKPTYRPPLSEEVERTKARVADLELTIAEMMAQ